MNTYYSLKSLKLILLFTAVVVSLTMVTLVLGLTSVVSKNAQQGLQYEDITLSLNPTWTKTGANGWDYFGTDISRAGDLNGDGHADAIIDGFETGDASNGPRFSYLFYGHEEGFDQEANEATEEGRLFFAGNINNDAYDDLFFQRTDSTYLDLYLGTDSGISLSSPITLTGLILPGEEVKVAPAGDINKDGFEDVIVGAPENAEQGENAGKIYVYLGSSSGIVSTPIFTDVGSNEDDWFGAHVGSAGDVNKDGYDDLLVGASRLTNSGIGYVRLYLGNSSGIDASKTITLTGLLANETFAKNSISPAGDVNKDGYDDVMVVAHYPEGRVYIYHGGASGLNSTPATIIDTNDTDGFFIIRVQAAGDVDGDGFADIVAVNGDYADNGRVYLFPGSASGIHTTPRFIGASDARPAFTNYGSGMVSLGDVDGDSRSDILISAPTEKGSDLYSGRVYLYSDHRVFVNPIPSMTLSGNEEDDYFGQNLEMADVNGDGFADLLVGIPEANGRRGEVHLYHGSATGVSSVPDFTAVGECSSNEFGAILRSAGDINKDGREDILVTAPGEYGCSSQSVYIYYGSDAGFTQPVTLTVGVGDFTINLKASPAGDVNNDGYSDVIIGNRYDDGGGNNAGAAFIYHGSATGLSASPNQTLRGTMAGDDVGIHVDGVGDVNNDGYDDVLVTSFPNVGKTQKLYYGSASGVGATAVWTITTENNLFYRSAGDINGDGHADLIFAQLTAGESDQGLLMFYYGSTLGLPTSPSTTVEGQSFEEQLGRFIKAVGDVNQDGYDDFLIGNAFFDLRAVDAGIVSLYEGGPNGLRLSELFRYAGETFGAYAETAVAGDVDNDGEVDFFIGAIGVDSTNPSMTNTGQVFGFMNAFRQDAPNANDEISIYLPFVQKK